MATSNFITMLHEAAGKIKTELQKVYRLRFEEEKLKSFDSERQKFLLESIKEYDKKILECKKELDLLDPSDSGTKLLK